MAGRMQQLQASSPDPNKVTCDDLFQALLSSASSVVLPQVPPTAPSSSSPTASVVSSDSDLPSQLPQSQTQGSSPASSLRSTPSREYNEDEPPDNHDDEYDDYDQYDDNEDDRQQHDGLSSSSVSTIDLVVKEPDIIRTVSELSVDGPWDAVRKSRAGSGEDVLYGPRRLRNILGERITVAWKWVHVGNAQRDPTLLDVGVLCVRVVHDSGDLASRPGAQQYPKEEPHSAVLPI